MTDALIARLIRARGMIGAMCQEGRPPKMSIPANRERDEDLYICDTIDQAIAALKARAGKGGGDGLQYGEN